MLNSGVGRTVRRGSPVLRHGVGGGRGAHSGLLPIAGRVSMAQQGEGDVLLHPRAPCGVGQIVCDSLQARCGRS